MRRPRVTMSRNGRISSGRVGPPNAISSTASCGMELSPVGELVHDVHERLHVLDGRVLVDAVTEVEDVTGPTARGVQHGFRPHPYIWGRRQQHGRIEIPLHRDVVTDACPSRGEIHAPVE